jgi:hypothetical protein
MRRSTKCAGAVLASLIVLGAAAVPATAAGHDHPVGAALLRDGYPGTASRNDELWYREGTTLGTATLTKQFGAPTGYGDGALKLTTDDQIDASAQLFTYHLAFGAPLAALTGFAYWTYESSPTSAEADAAYRLRVDIDGDFTTTSDITDLLYEPRWNDTEGPDPQQPIAPATWQYWDATNGAWWTTRKITCGVFVVEAARVSFTTPAAVATNCAGAKAVAIGVTVGPSSPNSVVATDGLQLQTTDGTFTWNFGPK